MYIAQREFVQAVDLVMRAQDFCQNHGSESPTVRETSVRLQDKIQHLILVLGMNYTETEGTKIKNHKWKYVHWH